MSAVTLHTFATKAEWLAARHEHLTATDAAAVLGMNPRKSAWKVYQEKSQAPGDDLDLEYEEAAKWGTLLEEPIAAETARRLGRVLVSPADPRVAGSRWAFFTNTNLSFPLAVSVDRIVSATPVTWKQDDTTGAWTAVVVKPCAVCEGSGGDPRSPPPRPPRPCPTCKGMRSNVLDPRGQGLAEIKAVSAFIDREEWGSEGPVPYIVQLQVQLGVTMLNWGVLSGLSGGQKLQIIEHARDDEFFSWAYDHLEIFWKNTRKGIPPDPDGSESTRIAIGKYYRGGNGAAVELPPIAALWAKQRAEGKATIKTAENAVREAENLIKAAMGESTEALLPGGATGFRWPVVTPRAKTCGYCKGSGHLEPESYRRLDDFEVKVKKEKKRAKGPRDSGWEG